MQKISAQKALRHATDDELLWLYGVVLGGWTLTALGQFTFGTSRQVFGSLIGLVALLAGILLILTGVVAIARKVLVESRPE